MDQSDLIDKVAEAICNTQSYDGESVSVTRWKFQSFRSRPKYRHMARAAIEAIDQTSDVEYAVLHDNGNDEAWISERPCGCEHTFAHIEDVLAYYNLEVTDTIVYRTVTAWKPREGAL